MTNIQDIQVWSPVLQQAVPVAQVVSGFETVWENQVIGGRDRMQTIIASANPRGPLAAPLFTYAVGATRPVSDRPSRTSDAA